MKKLFIVLFVVFSIRSIHSEEGMIIPTILGAFESDMQAMGMKLTAKDIFDVNNASIKDAIIHFGGGCTAEIVSKKGLIFTNHHCGLSQINSHSSLENNILKNGFWAKDVSEELRNDAILVFKAVSNNHEVLKYASDALRNEFSFIRKVISVNPKALQYASDEMLNNQELVFTAINKDRSLINYVGEELKSNKSFVNEIVRIDPKIITNYESMILLAIENDANNYNHYSKDSFRINKEFLIKALEKNGFVFNLIPSRFQEDRDFILEAVSKSDNVLKYISDAFQNDKEIVEASVRKDPSTLQYASETLQQDSEFVKELVKLKAKTILYVKDISNYKHSNPYAYRYMPKSAMKDFQFASPQLYDDFDIFLKLVARYSTNINLNEIPPAIIQEEIGKLVKYFDQRWFSDPKTIRLVIEQNNRNFDIAKYTSFIIHFLDESVKSNEDFMSQLIALNGHVLEHLDPNFLANQSIIINAIKYQKSMQFYTSPLDIWGMDIVKNLSYGLRYNKKFMMSYLEIMPELFEYLYSDYRNDLDIASIAIIRSPLMMKYAGPVVRDNRHLASIAVSKESAVLEYLSDELRNDQEIVLKAVKKQSSSIILAGEKLLDNISLILEELSTKQVEIVNNYLLKYRELRKDGLEKSSNKINKVWKKTPKMKFANESELSNRETVFDQVDWDVFNFQYVDPTLTLDKQFIIEIMKNLAENVDLYTRDYQLSHFFSLLDESLRVNREFIFELIDASKGVIIHELEANYRTDIEVITRAIIHYAKAIMYAPDELKNDKTFIIELLKTYKGPIENNWILYYTNQEYLNDRDFAYEVLSVNPRLLLFFSKEIRNDREVILFAVEKDYRSLKYASDELKRDDEIIKKAIEETDAALIYIDDNLRYKYE